MSGKRRALSSTRSAPLAALTALSEGQPSRGRTRRRSSSPQFSIARAAVPIFSPSCGSTRMIAGPPPAMPPRLLSVPATRPDSSNRGRSGRHFVSAGRARRPRSICQSSFPAPGGGAVGLVFEDDALAEELVADMVGIGKAALLAGAGALGDARLDFGCFGIRRAAQPGGGVAFQNTHQ